MQYGKGVVIVEPSNLYECTLGDGVYVGPFVEIQRGVKVGANTKIQSHSFICELVDIGHDCFIGQGVVFINDLFSDGAPSGNPSHWRRTIIAERAFDEIAWLYHDNAPAKGYARYLAASICERSRFCVHHSVRNNRAGLPA